MSLPSAFSLSAPASSTLSISAPSSFHPPTLAKESTSPRRPLDLNPFPCKDERLSIIWRIKPRHRTHMHRRLHQLRGTDPTALGADPAICLELWRMRIDGEIESWDGEFSRAEELKAFRHVYGGAERSGGAVGGPRTAWGMGVDGSIFSGRPLDGPVAGRSAATGTAGQRELAESLVGVGSWSEIEIHDDYGDEHLAAEDTIEMTAAGGIGDMADDILSLDAVGSSTRDDTTFRLFDASPAA